MKLISKILISLIVITCSSIAWADKMPVGEMNKICLSAFMKNADKVSDKDVYKSYVNKVCQCTDHKVTNKDIDQNLVMLSMGSCMRTTLLTETMNRIKDNDSLTEDKITSTCANEWKIVTSYDKKGQVSFEKICACAAKEIMGLDKKNRINESALEQIATSCVVKNKS